MSRIGTSSQERLEAEYNPRATVGDPQPYFQRAAEASKRARSTLKGKYDLRYGIGPKMTLDIFPASPGTPIHVFIHGGFWRGRDKADYSFLASTLVPEGITTLIANYDLCPSVTVTQIVDEIATLFGWIAENRAELGGGSRIVASGHSAGAHLIAMAHDQSLPARLAEGPVDHAILISGVYDLEPITRVSVNSEIRLDEVEARRMSPMVHIPHPSLPIDIVVGGAESLSWIDQSQRFSVAVSNPSRILACHVLADHNHYSIMEEAMDPNSSLSRLMIARSLGL